MVWSGHALRTLERHQLSAGQGAHVPFESRKNSGSHSHGQASAAEPTAVKVALAGGLSHWGQTVSWVTLHVEARY
jgi:hypothetical protein